MLDVILATKTSNHANHVSLVLGCFRSSLEDGPLLATPSPFKPLLKPWDFFAFPTWDWPYSSLGCKVKQWSTSRP